MKPLILIGSVTLLALIGAALLVVYPSPIKNSTTPSVLSSDELGVYGTDPMMHTIYMGSDESHHHFRYQNGKSGGYALVPVDEAVIQPQSVPLDSGYEPFVESSGSGEIQLLVLEATD